MATLFVTKLDFIMKSISVLRSLSSTFEISTFQKGLRDVVILESAERKNVRNLEISEDAYV